MDTLKNKLRTFGIDTIISGSLQIPWFLPLRPGFQGDLSIYVSR